MWYNVSTSLQVHTLQCSQRSSPRAVELSGETQQIFIVALALAAVAILCRTLVLTVCLVQLALCACKLLFDALPMQATSPGMLDDASLFFVCRDQWGHRGRLSVLVQRHIDNIAAGDLANLSRDQIFGCDLYTDLHTCASDIVHRAVDGDDIADEGRRQKVEAFDARRNHRRTMRMLDSDDSSRLVDHSHYYSAVYIALAIAIDQLHHAACRAL